MSIVVVMVVDRVAMVVVVAVVNIITVTRGCDDILEE